ncbi:TIR domain-containing protein [Streptomyces sp. SID2563]|uniref:toll/interleukin-1 receptor domain-containing protein n=1 Tax=Streptomyces sp. SID2563 TaxID=2690255 RepID=UPI00136F06D5|nr:toll/interleukin-1 receptor domain-containing protein [Streptomyces sp. SID2563]MYW07282.1 TIR domain-containing protein [Streptomyces sp. SID2563]
MQIFISWSGVMAQRCAEALRDWLPYMNQAITPFVSSQDISKGERGLNKIADQLQECSFGIVCVTRANQSAPWINFESGALSRELGESSLIPFLIDMQVKDLSSGPLTQFQAVDGSHQSDVWEMVKAINAKCDAAVELDRLRKTFERWWGDLEEQLSTIRGEQPVANGPQRDVAEILDELVKLVREQHTRIGALEKVIGNSGATLHAMNERAEVQIAGRSERAKRSNKVEHWGRAEKELWEIMGHEYLERTKISGGILTCYVNEKGLERVRQMSKKLQELAEQSGVGVDFYGPGGMILVSFPPF